MHQIPMMWSRTWKGLIEGIKRLEPYASVTCSGVVSAGKYGSTRENGASRDIGYDEAYGAGDSGSGRGTFPIDPGMNEYGWIRHPAMAEGTGFGASGAYGRPEDHRQGSPGIIMGWVRIYSGSGYGHLGPGGLPWYSLIWANGYDLRSMVAWELACRAKDAGVPDCEIDLEQLADPLLRIYSELPKAWENV